LQRVIIADTTCRHIHVLYYYNMASVRRARSVFVAHNNNNNNNNYPLIVASLNRIHIVLCPRQGISVPIVCSRPLSVYIIYTYPHTDDCGSSSSIMYFIRCVWYYFTRTTTIIIIIIIIIRCMRLIREKAKHSRRLYNYHTRNKDEKK